MDYMVEFQTGKTTEEAICKLQMQVQENIKLGFVPIGGISVNKEKKYYSQWVIEYIASQAMVKDEH